MSGNILCCQNGWAILIILIVAGVLAYYGIFAPQGFLNVYHNNTRAIYDGEVLRDYIIVCKDDNVINAIPTENFVVAGTEWVDDRPEESWC